MSTLAGNVCDLQQSLQKSMSVGHWEFTLSQNNFSPHIVFMQMINNPKKMSKINKIFFYKPHTPFNVFFWTKFHLHSYVHYVCNNFDTSWWTPTGNCLQAQQSHIEQLEISSFKTNKQDYEYIWVEIKIEVLNILLLFLSFLSYCFFLVQRDLDGHCDL